jgi:hypothetical protein
MFIPREPDVIETSIFSCDFQLVAGPVEPVGGARRASVQGTVGRALRALSTVPAGSGSRPEQCSLPPLRCGQTSPVCGPTEEAGVSWSQAGPWVARGAARGLGGRSLRQPGRSIV